MSLATTTLLLLCFVVAGTNAFTIQPRATALRSSPPLITASTSTATTSSSPHRQTSRPPYLIGVHLAAINKRGEDVDDDDDEDDDDDLKREYARVRRRGVGRRSYYEDDAEDVANDLYGNGRRNDDDNRAAQEARNVGDKFYDDVDYYDDDDDDDVDDVDEDEEYSFFGSGVIPNPLLDSIDPDGAADRFPELARDPRFWFDMLLFVAFLDFLSFVGPRDQLELYPWT